MSGATRVGDVVRKPTQPQSETVQRLVRHVRAQGVMWAAEPLGIQSGYDLWRFIPGGVSHDDPHDGYPGVVVEEIARILRWPAQDVSLTKPLMEIGLDSLMAVELGLALETRFALDAPLTASASGRHSDPPVALRLPAALPAAIARR